MNSSISKPLAVARSVLVLAALVVALPVALRAAAQRRFGGPVPWHGMPAPSQWTPSRIESALSNRVGDAVLADIAIRTALVVAWVSLFVFLATVLVETIHMVRHAGTHLPDVGGLGMPQRAARTIAAGLLVVLPMIASPGRATAATPPLQPLSRSVATVLAPVHDAVQTPAMRNVTATAASEVYAVQSGDSVFGIAERLAGPDPMRVADFADRLVELNLGHQMNDGQWFTNAALIDVGWSLQLPQVGGGESPESPAVTPLTAPGRHVVEPGESLWSIADEELGDPLRWSELYDLNHDRQFDDGRTFDDASIIQPGWDLALPALEAPVAPPAAPPTDAPVAIPVVVEPVAIAPTQPKLSPDVSPDVSQPPRIAADHHVVIEIDDADVASHDNRWLDHPSIVPEPSGTAAPATVDRAVPATSSPDSDSTGDESLPRLLTFGRAAMLGAGLLALLAIRRGSRLRSAQPGSRIPTPSPRQDATERSLRAIGSGERFARVDVAVRSATLAMIERQRRLVSVLCSVDGAIELRASGPFELERPWEPGSDGDRWVLPAITPIELLAPAARLVAVAHPTLVQIGCDVSGGDVYIDLESLEAIEVSGPATVAGAVVAGIAATLACSVLAEVTPIFTVGLAAEVALEHRLHRPFDDVPAALVAASSSVGWTQSMAASATTFELRARATAGETWEPAVVLIGSGGRRAFLEDEAVRLPADRRGQAVVSSVPLLGPSSVLAPDGDAWVLRPAGIRLHPVGLADADLAALVELVAVPEPVVIDDGDDSTIYGARDDHERDLPVASDRREWEILVRLLGPVTVVDGDGVEARFERSKARELVAWLATHRARGTRSNARTALWEQDVRDATFANVVSDARRSLARLVEPSAGCDWIERTLTDSLPIDRCVITDAELVERALAAARHQPPAQAIETLQPAVDLIVGIPFEGTTYLWPDAEGLTSNLILLAITAAAELATHYLAIGDVAGVFAATGRGLQVLPGHEQLIALRMQAHGRAGDHAGVRHEWDSYERLINADPWSDGEPSPKLAELRSQLLNPSR